jgi:hypothetical protein
MGSINYGSYMKDCKEYKTMVIDSKGNLVERPKEKVRKKKVPVIKGTRKKSSREKS